MAAGWWRLSAGTFPPQGSLFEMPSVYYTRQELEDTNPNRDTGLERASEQRYRTAVCGFIFDAGRALNLPQLTIATSLVYCQRLFTVKPIQSDRFAASMACLWLATQVEQHLIPLNRIIYVCFNVKNDNDPVKLKTLYNQQFFEGLVQKVLQIQVEVVCACGNVVKFDHPYIYGFTYLRYMLVKGMLHEQQYKDMEHVTNNLLHDSFRTQLSVQYDPEWIAVSLVFLSGRLLNVDIDGQFMLEACGILSATVEDICSQFLELYEHTHLVANSLGLTPDSDLCCDQEEFDTASEDGGI